jgi:hypothetical protein
VAEPIGLILGFERPAQAPITPPHSVLPATGMRVSVRSPTIPGDIARNLIRRQPLELFHNTRRRHSALGMLTPTEYEDLHNTTRKPPDSRTATPKKRGRSESP